VDEDPTRGISPETGALPEEFRDLRGQRAKTAEPDFREWVKKILEPTGEDLEAGAAAKSQVLSMIRQGRASMKEDREKFASEREAIGAYRSRVKTLDMWAKAEFIQWDAVIEGAEGSGTDTSGWSSGITSDSGTDRSSEGSPSAASLTGSEAKAREALRTKAEQLKVEEETRKGQAQALGLE